MSPRMKKAVNVTFPVCKTIFYIKYIYENDFEDIIQAQSTICKTLYITLHFSTYRAKILCFCLTLIPNVCSTQPSWLDIISSICPRIVHLVGPKNWLVIYLRPPDFKWCFLLSFTLISSLQNTVTNNCCSWRRISDYFWTHLNSQFLISHLSNKVCNETQEFHRLFCHRRGQEISSFMVSPSVTMREAAKILRRTLKVLNYLSSLQKIIILVFH